MFNPLKLWNSKYNEDLEDKPTFFIKLFILNIKTVYSTMATKLVIILSPVFVAFALAILMPITLSVGAGQIFVGTLSAGVIWGMTYFSIRKSTFYSNLSITKASDIGIYISIFMTMFIVTLSSQLTYWISTIIFDFIIPSSMIELIYNVDNEESHMNWLKVDWITIIYSWIISVSLVFVICFSTRNFLTTDKTFFISLLIYILILVPFGGLIRPNLKTSGNIIAFDGIPRPQYISILFPQFHLNCFNFAAVSAGKNYEVSAPINKSFVFLSSFHWSNDPFWNTTILYPPIFLMLITLLSIPTIGK